ncbi:hypothetical protein BBP00_00008273 [Phytophthora kernoviae]|uniref:Piwi domain-containing protein n=2 Tax=Phytophthora kernoviae TaxID=325452 RepID=A0A3F2RFW7_9STRA|nr:hypothetical protein BBP00_00008273 [Phytophthora kernoviae]
MVDMINKCELTVEDGNPFITHQDQDRGAQVEELMKIDTLLGIPSQCIVSKNVRSAKPPYCTNVCLKFNMKLGGNNWVLCEPLPLSTSGKPEYVICYRDGVSKGRFYETLQVSLRKAFKMTSEDYNRPVTFIIVNKRHHMRAFPVNQRDGDRKGNVMPGTVIDTGIVDSHRYDFFLYDHSGIQGTSVPCHYTVLHDENKMSAEDVQRLTYHIG